MSQETRGVARTVFEAQLRSRVSTARTRRLMSGDGSRRSLRKAWAETVSTVRSLTMSSPAMPALDRPCCQQDRSDFDTR